MSQSEFARVCATPPNMTTALASHTQKRRRCRGPDRQRLLFPDPPPQTRPNCPIRLAAAEARKEGERSSRGEGPSFVQTQLNLN